jgi:hypothetical protein
MILPPENYSSMASEGVQKGRHYQQQELSSEQSYQQELRILPKLRGSPALVC